jgi:GH25 family lysozyme M1 (1,4-beta-N-acetylmuramidase)
VPISFTAPIDQSIFPLEVPVTFKGKADFYLWHVRSQIAVGGDNVESGDWTVTYPKFNKPGLREIRVVGFDSANNRVSTSKISIALTTNVDPSGFEPGIDVSDHDDIVNWQQVRSAGYTFAFAKATEGETFKADTFPRNWRVMHGAGVIRGAYHFFRPTKDPEKQAYHFLNYVQSVESIQPNDLPPALDLEHFPSYIQQEWESLRQPERVKRVRTWLEVVESEIKRKPIIYTSFGFWSEFMSGITDFADYPLWVANYTNRAKPLIPNEWSSWTFWQYTDTTEVPGIPNSQEDGNRFNGSLIELSAFIKSTIL